MSRYAAFLRGMNVGGHRLTNEDLRSHFSAMDFTEVATFRASGNVVFAGEGAKPATVAARIEAGLNEALGYAVPTFVRTAEQVQAIAAMEPFSPAHVKASTGKLQVAMLSAAPSASMRKQVLSLASEDDRLDFDGCELYWLPIAGVLDTTIDWKAVEKLLGTMTTRTKNTVEQIASKHFAD